MNIWHIILGIVLILVSIAIIIVIILQEGNQQGVGVVTGGIDAFLSRWTKVFAVIFVLAVIGLNVVSYFIK